MSLLAACDDPGRPVACRFGDSARAISGTFLTWNLYLGAAVDRLILAHPTERPAIVEEGFQQLVATNFGERAQAIALGIDSVDPDVIGLQEVAHWSMQSPGDQSGDSPTPATETFADFLAMLLSALEERGLVYQPVAITTNVDIELPSASGDDIRFRDRDVILARSGVAAFNPQSGTFLARFRLDDDITVVRGWASIDAVVAGETVRFVTTHLETEELERLLRLQQAQVGELLEILCDADLPIVVAGDFNSDPQDATTSAYDAFDRAGFVDAWSVANPQATGFTCCQAPDLTNSTSLLSHRVDFVWFRGSVPSVDATVLGAEPTERTPSGLWPSDHAGVVATLRR